MIIIYALEDLNLNRPVSNHSVEDCAHAVVRHLSHDHDPKNVCLQTILIQAFYSITTTTVQLPSVSKSSILLYKSNRTRHQSKSLNVIESSVTIPYCNKSFSRSHKRICSIIVCSKHAQ